MTAKLARGKFIIQNGKGTDVLVMFPDGTVRVALDAVQAQKFVLKWTSAAVKRNGVGAVVIVEWTGVTPPHVADHTDRLLRQPAGVEEPR